MLERRGKGAEKATAVATTLLLDHHSSAETQGLDVAEPLPVCIKGDRTPTGFRKEEVSERQNASQPSPLGQSKSVKEGVASKKESDRSQSLAEATQVKPVSKNSDVSLPYSNIHKQALTAQKTMASSESATMHQEIAPVLQMPHYGTMNSLQKSDEIRNVVQIFDNDVATSRIHAMNIRESQSNRHILREPSNLKVAIGLSVRAAAEESRRYSKPTKVFDFTTPLRSAKLSSKSGSTAENKIYATQVQK